MDRPLEGLTVVEGSAFVAAPSGGMALAQLGAEVIRFDRIGGGIDHKRWPLTPDGASLYWNGLNKENVPLRSTLLEGKDRSWLLSSSDGLETLLLISLLRAGCRIKV